MKLDEEEKSSFDSIPSETNDEFIAIICRIVDDGDGDRFFLIRLYQELRACQALTQRLILVCVSVSDVEGGSASENTLFFKQHLPQAQSNILTIDEFLAKLREHQLGQCHGIIE